MTNFHGVLQAIARRLFNQWDDCVSDVIAFSFTLHGSGEGTDSATSTDKPEKGLEISHGFREGDRSSGGDMISFPDGGRTSPGKCCHWDQVYGCVAKLEWIRGDVISRIFQSKILPPLLLLNLCGMCKVSEGSDQFS